MRGAPRRVATVVVTVMLASRATQSDGPLRRIRPTTAAITALLDQATQWSPTLQAITAAINKSDGLVYIEEGECRGHVRACMVHAVAVAGPNRLLHIRIDPRRNDLDTQGVDPDLIGRLGHELQHAAEVLRNPRLRTSADIVSFYMREGTFSTGTVLETAEAEQAGLAIADEVRRALKNHSNH